jgi:transcriptional regulator with XRE-family HTH domain
VRALRRHLGLTQVELAQELGTRQATISEWEHGVYQPRGTSARVLGLLAERAGFEYETRRTGQGYTRGKGEGEASSNEDTLST